MVDYDAGSRELRKNFERAVDFIGEEWLEQERSKEYTDDFRDHKHQASPHPLVVKYHRGRVELFDEKIDAPELFTDEHYSTNTHQLVVIGEHLRHISGSQVRNPSGKIVSEEVHPCLRPRIQNVDEWQETLFEVETAAAYAREGYQVDFIQEGNTKAPDLLISDKSKIFVECKRCNTVSGRHQKHGGKQEVIQKAIESKYDGDLIITVDIFREPSSSEVHSFSEHLPDESKIDGFHTERIIFCDVSFIPLNNHENQMFVERTPNTVGQVPLKFYNKYVRPEVKEHLGQEFELSKFSGKHLHTKVPGSQEQTDKFLINHAQFIGILEEFEVDRVKQVLRQFNRARGKYSADSPNILHIGVPFLSNFTYDEFDSLCNGINGKLNLSKSISGVVISTSEYKVEKDASLLFGMNIGYVENLTPRHEVPKWFDFPGDPLQRLPDRLSLQR
ncbi:hypothetical protein [Salinigranum rubrum]|uniref:hypothetical protein n=1 Tax=Salinigranum rubrum TaxID=755307 RepID=UPI0013A54981|nr:hypothetical protein [Salinigranum rubrum]